MSEQEHRSVGRARVLGRARRENVEGGRRGRFVVKSTPEEELRLRTLAAQHGVSVPRLLVESTLAAHAGPADDAPLTITERRQAAAELFGISRLLGTVANNVNQMARATNATGELHEDLEATLRYVREVLGPRVERAVDEVVAQ
ncbi:MULTISPECIES: MobC family plasmid mobilization relaxosome protein [Cellulomonas]|uniref:MobC family plasmid mobilization relaxosome protein n=1 Tax=Cellulomonas denverensis TaxID=264297 RepID=A0A7X6KY82_9CELL|nr:MULTISPECIES: MobC family plasmid mobilization relaxosome protein [Cellulomonas]NKY24396.1 MobC family plasmid mobilization relaxosome protein [Cellulomonas denverensis]QZN87744.1 MobC family plasmid mobilization relaxosome protein [Cellulomonas sp. C5510]GIG26483.1 hypothetical protein Cde04nite_27270 [Cellulomonas denverensis]